MYRKNNMTAINMAAWVSQAAIFIRFAKSFVNDLHFIWYYWSTGR